MFDRTPTRVTLPKDFKPPEDYRKVFKKRPTGALRYISRVDEADGTILNRVRLHLNEALTEAEKGRFGHLMHMEHLEWFGCACWGSNGSNLTVRISIKNNQHLADARQEVGKHADLVLAQIFAERKNKKKR
jgi:hypothetical protein